MAGPASEVQRRAAKKVQPDRSSRQTDFERAQIQLGDLALPPSLPPSRTMNGLLRAHQADRLSAALNG